MSELLLPPEHRYAEIVKKRQNEDGSELSILNLGPTHPATHGIFQNILLMDGERILEAEPTIGYIHRAFEKIAEKPPFCVPKCRIESPIPVGSTLITSAPWSHKIMVASEAVTTLESSRIFTPFRGLALLIELT